MIDNQRGECALPGDVILSLCFFACCSLFSIFAEMLTYII